MQTKLLRVLLIGLCLLLAACGKTPVNSSNENQEHEEAETDIDTVTNDEVETLTSESNREKEEDPDQMIPKENLLGSPKKINHPQKDIEITYTDAFFTMQLKPTGRNSKDAMNILATDKEIYFHVIAKIYNDTTDAFHFSRLEGDGKVILIYDNKHEFEFIAAAESSDGSTFGSSRAEPLTETIAHFYAKVPIAVYQSKGPLELKINVGDEEYNIELR
ncbi:hypothetical protein BEP19_10660 [Ammoniphilus oxalaticus]|uniref:DUF4352 domain-containing protein n=1 Tax=Ammoniphilus oxalaticus TaxID=66863 RepID=A0A419SG04_9BACL|nr:hypothetical protein [Ammoniphilus oxalaticus]RKD22709.1 hypothetical protein BEP19_10660 [Ammoniphilus oxalaticus]